MQGIFRHLAGIVAGAVVAVGIIAAIDANAQDVPQTTIAEPAVEPVEVATIDAGAAHYINYQGQLFNPNTNTPLANTAVNASFRLYGASNGTNELWRENKVVVTNVDGVFNTSLGDVVAFDLDIFDGRELYLGIAINNELTNPLQRITYTVYAFWARQADNLGEYAERDFPKIVAYGVVDEDGDRESGYNFDSTRDLVADAEVYIIDIPGISHSINDFTTIITPACIRPVMFGVGTSAGDLVVDMWDQNGNRTTCRFEFMVLRRRE